MVGNEGGGYDEGWPEENEGFNRVWGGWARIRRVGGDTNHLKGDY